ncbi:hypothetical protein EYF80_051636 [Liparis tanakae]|uniref:Uncharacterized protein n=1 Tax=Liparis tanakae TaxID=230148 RepID=A0A4Z2FBM2_9TELE|nr:hypothetical protein EYF80_051636 [Liparis tanakae]
MADSADISTSLLRGGEEVKETAPRGERRSNETYKRIPDLLLLQLQLHAQLLALVLQLSDATAQRVGRLHSVGKTGSERVETRPRVTRRSPVCRSGSYLVAAASATARAAVASSIFFLLRSSVSCFSARPRASCSAFSRFSSWEMVCLSFCLDWMALWSLGGPWCQQRLNWDTDPSFAAST